MTKKDIGILPPFFERYINQTPDLDLMELLQANRTVFDGLSPELMKLGDYKYQPGKWTIKEVLQHVIDNERIQSYRALRIMRGDETSLPGYDQDILATDTFFPDKEVSTLLKEYKTVRDTTIMMFQFIPDHMLLRTGLCSNIKISALSLGFVVAGHAIHHEKILRDLYL